MRKLDRQIMDKLGTDWCGTTAPPMTNRTIYVQEEGVTRVFSRIEDGGFVGIGYLTDWHVIMRSQSARIFAWWTIKMWIFDWFGLRTNLWYRALNHHLNGTWKRLRREKSKFAHKTRAPS